MRITGAWRSTLALLAVLASCSGKPGLSDAEKARGEALFAAHCAACHDAKGGDAPSRTALQARKAEAIVAALTSGLMREQGKSLSVEERRLLANYLGAGKAQLAGTDCEGRLALKGAALWNRWGNGTDNARYQPAANGGLSPSDVSRLELAWAFAFPDAARARSQPAVTAEAIFTGSQDGRVYALDLATGCVWWTFDADAEVRSAPTLGSDAAGQIDRIYFGDFNASVYALDARTGELVWKRSVRDHPAGTITGSPTLHGGRLYVPMSSTEVVSAMRGEYECCSFRGGVTALEAATGKPVWRMYTVDPAKQAGTDRKGQRALGPSGVPVWSPPTVDPKRGLLYFGTGENYSSPASALSDSIVAIELATGKLRWWQQTVANDAWNASCSKSGDNANCPREDGPDLDFGAPPILAQLPGGREMIVAGQKSGMIFGLDPDQRGRIVWRRRAGMGGFNGGVHWGMASHGGMLFAGIADTLGGKSPVGPRRPGLHAFDIASGTPLWSRIEPDTCARRSFACETAISAPVTLTDGVVFAGTHNGLVRAYASGDGRLLWSFDTRRSFATVNGIAGTGGSIDSAGPVVAGGRLIVNSGYDKFGEIPGNLLLVFAPRGKR
jgi:polyvinyl alcohol dehydrogenase (cytochrome)